MTFYPITMMSLPKEKFPIDGILLLNKPTGLSSNAILQKVKRLFQARKAGHTGSLDPLATGMLPICFGEATKLSQYLLNAKKTYQATGLLGIKTTTADSEGEILSQVEDFTVNAEQLLAVLEQFLGRTNQIPSMFSALKHQGRPLYELARRGLDVERKPREIIIDKLKLLAFDGLTFTIEVTCSKGTYIRNLVEDVGEALGIHAHVIQLHRKSAGCFTEEPMFTLDELNMMTALERQHTLLPMERAVEHLPELCLNPEGILALQQGKQVFHPDPSLLGLVRLHGEGGQFYGLAECGEEGWVKVKRLTSF